jgi:gamma-glutamyltranspeptidase/glutathione hydrolase
MRDFELPGRSPVLSTQAMVATSHPLAAQIALRMLQEGGNAADAAIAAAAALAVCEPHMCGLGGDTFALIRPAGDTRLIALNGSGRAPAGLDSATLRARGWTKIPLGSAEAVTLPGAVDAFCQLSLDWGLLGLDQVLAPAIACAEGGVPVAPRVAADWTRTQATLQGAARRHFLHADKPPAVGDIFRAPGLAEVLRRIIRDGRAGFYEGEVAEDILATLRAAGGPHTIDDFAATRTTYEAPVSSVYRDIELVEHPPNGQGVIASLILNILSQFDLASHDPFGPDRLHLEAEASKLAYDARDRFLADADHMTRLDHLLAEETAQKLAALIDPRRALPGPAPGAGAVHRDTVLITVVDRDGMAVSLIHSLFNAFGSGLASDRFGILLHSRGAGFTLDQGHPNEAAGGKRPLHTIIPAMLRQGGRVVMPFGVMGGAYQACGHARLVSNILDFGMDVQEAIDGPRSFAWDGALQFERGHRAGVAEALAALGHKITAPPAPIGGAQAIWIDHARGVLIGGSDPRKDGCAIGY